MFVGLGDELLDRSPFELSGGQKRRVAIAGVIAVRLTCLFSTSRERLTRAAARHNRQHKALSPCHQPP